MKFRSNLLEEVPRYFHRQLDDLYDPNEVESIAFLAIERYQGFSRTQFVMHAKDRLSESDMLKYIHCVKELETGRPVQYVLEEAHFRNLKLYVAEGVLIPRPETEELIQWIVEDDTREPLKVLDIGSGSGCIPLALKDELKQAQVTSVDISERALNIAARNGLNLNLTVDFARLDVLSEDLPEQDWDIIVSNPPYVTVDEKGQMHKNVLDFEPDEALFVSNEDPLLFYRRIAEQGQSKLIDGGRMYFEINRSFGPQTVQLLEELGYEQVELRKDLVGNDRMIKAIWRKHE